MIINKNVLCNGTLYTKGQEIDQDDDNIEMLVTEGHTDGELAPKKPAKPTKPTADDSVER